MKRVETGSYEVTTAGGEAVRALVPAPLPPTPPLAFDGGLQPALEAAVLAVGRLLVTLLLCHAALLHEPLLYLSLHLKERRADYYALLDGVRRDGDWEAWLAFFLEGVRVTAEGAVETAQRLAQIFRDDRAAIEPRGRRAGSALRVHEALKARPILSLPAICERTGLSFPAASSAIDLLAELGMARELTGKRRNRLFVYDRYLAILNEGTEPP